MNVFLFQYEFSNQERQLERIWKTFSPLELVQINRYLLYCAYRVQRDRGLDEVFVSIINSSTTAAFLIKLILIINDR